MGRGLGFFFGGGNIESLILDQIILNYALFFQVEWLRLKNKALGWRCEVGVVEAYLVLKALRPTNE